MTFNPQKFAEQRGSLSKKLALVFDAIGATHDGQPTTGTLGRIFGIGYYGSYKVIAALEDNVAVPIFLNSTVEATSDDTSFIGIMCSIKNTLVDQPHKHMQCILSSTNLYFDCFDAYAVQAHITFLTSMNTQNANAHLTGISGKADVRSGVTVSKGWVTAGLFIIDGGGAVTGAGTMCHGVAIIAEATATASMCTSLLYLDADIAVPQAIEIVGGARMTYALKIDGSSGAAVVAAGQPAGHSAAGYISVYVGASAYAVPFWAVADMANS